MLATFLCEGPYSKLFHQLWGLDSSHREFVNQQA